MSFKTTYILFIALVCILGLLLLIQLRGTKPEDQTAYVFPSLTKDKVENKDINGIEIERPGTQADKLVFLRREGGWILQQPQTRADSAQVNEIIGDLMRAGKVDDQADMSGGLAQYGLDSPSALVTIRKGAEKSWKLTIGKASIGKENALIYVTSSDRPDEPMAVRRSQLSGLIKDVDDKGNIQFKEVTDYRDKTLLAGSMFDITAVKLQESKKEEVALEKTSDGRWRFEKPAFGDADYDGEPMPPGGTTTPTRITGVRELLQNVTDLKVDSATDFGATDVADAGLAEKGLEKGKETLRIEAKVQSTLSGDDKKGPVTTGLLIGKKAEVKPPAKDEPREGVGRGEEEKYYARLEDERNIVKVPAKKVDEILKVVANPSLIRNRDLVTIDSFKVDAIDVKLGERELIKLRHAGEPVVWKLYESGKVQEADNSSVQSLLTALANKRQVKDFPAASKSDAELGLDKPAVVVSLWADGIKKEEKKDEKKDDSATEAKKDDKKDGKAKEAKKEEKKDPNVEPKLKEEKPTVRLTFGKREKDLVYVRREAGTETMRLAVAANLLDKVSEGKLAYLDRKLPAFGSINDVVKLNLTHGSQSREIEKGKDDKGGENWKFKQPKEVAGRTAEINKVDRILTELHNLQAEKYVTEKASDSDLDRFGLAAPPIKVTLTLTKPDKKTEEHTYLFGKDTDDKTGVYAKESGRDMIFVIRKNVVEALEGDLQDPVVLSFDLAKFKGLKLVGWQDIIGSPFTLEAERKDSQNWTVKMPADFKLDTAKVEAFVSGLTHLQAERFLGPKTTGKAEYKLELREGALEVFLMIDGEKEPVRLTIGGPGGTNAYYAMISKLTNEVFVLPKGAFGDVKGRPAYFKKE
jgi:hypothetical protein